MHVLLTSLDVERASDVALEARLPLSRPPDRQDHATVGTWPGDVEIRQGPVRGASSHSAHVRALADTQAGGIGLEVASGGAGALVVMECELIGRIVRNLKVDGGDFGDDRSVRRATVFEVERPLDGRKVPVLDCLGPKHEPGLRIGDLYRDPDPFVIERFRVSFELPVV